MGETVRIQDDLYHAINRERMVMPNIMVGNVTISANS